MMDPQEFLDLTLSAQGQAILATMDPAQTRARPLDLDTLAQGGAPFLLVEEPAEPSEYQKKHYGLTSLPVTTMGHDGRHRMTALKAAG